MRLIFRAAGRPRRDTFRCTARRLFKELADVNNAGFNLTTMGEVLPRHENHVRINREVKDEWGIPVLHIQQKYTDNEYDMAKDATATAEEVCRGAGFEVIARHAQMVPPGESIHELGTCRMGSDPKKSVLNGFNQSHDVKNLS